MGTEQNVKRNIVKRQVKRNLKGNDMQLIAIGLGQGNPFAYLFLFMILYPPIAVIIFAIIDKIKKR